MASIARDDPSPLRGMHESKYDVGRYLHRDHNAPAQCGLRLQCAVNLALKNAVKYLCGRFHEARWLTIHAAVGVLNNYEVHYLSEKVLLELSDHVDKHGFLSADTVQFRHQAADVMLGRRHARQLSTTVHTVSPLHKTRSHCSHHLVSLHANSKIADFARSAQPTMCTRWSLSVS